MSEIEESLLGYDDELAARWKQENETRRYTWRGRDCGLAFAATLLLIFSSFLILYPQWHSVLKIPEKQITETLNRDLKLLLHPADHVSREPGVRQFVWNITRAKIAPDGVEKDVLLINNRFPGPTVEARSGDTLEIEVINLLDEGVSLHWHGLHMRGANHMDGPVGITQCSILPGEKFTYRVPIGDQAGTFWYHAHSEVQRGDGLYGGLVVHNSKAAEKLPLQYDNELLFLVGDWYHSPSKDVLGKFLSRTSTGHEPCPDSLLINGLGYFECSMAIPAAPVNCSEIQRPRLLLNKKDRYRIRLVNVGSLTGISLTIPDSEMNVIQVDGGQPVISHPANSVGVLYPAERVDFMVEWPESAIDTDSELIIELDTEYFLWPNFALTSNQSFLLSTEFPTRQLVTKETEIHKFYLRDAVGPTLSDPLPDAQKTFVLYTVVEVLAHQNSIPKGFINHTTWEPQSMPLITLDREHWDNHQLVPWTGSKPGWVELTINNIDGTGHPFHLHGFDFYVISSYEGKGGWDYYNPFNPSRPPRGGPFNLINPIRKDTVYVPPYGYVVIRFLADNEGIWALHCHIMWHQASGMSMAFHVLGDEHQGYSQSVVGLNAKQHCLMQLDRNIAE